MQSIFTCLRIPHLLAKKEVVLLATVAALAVALSIYSHQHYNSTANKILEIASKDITSNAKIQANDLSLILENGLDSVITNLQVLSSSPTIRNNDNDSLSLLDAVQESTNELPDFYMWLDKDGRLIWISGMNVTSYNSQKGLDLSHNQYFSVPRFTFAPYYSHGQIQSIDGIPRLYMSYPIIDKSTNSSTKLFKGVVVAAISFNVTDNILKRQASSSEVAGNSIILLDRSGEILLYSEDSNGNLPGRNIYENEIDFLGMQMDSYLINSFLKRSVNEPHSEFRDLVLDGGENRNTIVSDPIFVNGQHFWTIFVFAPHHLANDVIGLFNQQTSVSLVVIIMIIVVSSGIASIIMLWNKRLALLVNMRTRQLQLKSEELDEANWSLKDTNKRLSFINQQLLFSNKQLFEANKKLKNHDKIQKEFINIAAHELRTPIMPILGGLELLSDKLDNQTKEMIKEETSMITRNTERLHKLAEDILQVSTIETGNFKVDIQETNLDSLISTTIDDVKRKYSHERNIPIIMETGSSRHRQHKEQQEQHVDNKGKLELLSSPPERSLLCDPEKISQVVFNLLDNALKFTNRGMVIVSISKNYDVFGEKGASQDREREEFLVSIKDTGKGIDPSVKDRLFQRFASQSANGAGLGLYLSKKIIEAHGGRIWAESNNDGTQGSTFIFSLPIAGPENIQAVEI